MCQEVHDGADPRGALEVLMGEKPHFRARLGQRIACGAAQFDNTVAQEARQRRQPQAGAGGLAQCDQRVDPAVDAEIAAEP